MRSVRVIARMGTVAVIFAAGLIVGPAVNVFHAGSADATASSLPLTNTDYIIYNNAGTYTGVRSIDGFVLTTTSTVDVAQVVNAAITDMGSATGTIGFLSGTYNVETQIALPTGVGLVGTGNEHDNAVANFTILKAVSGFNGGSATIPMVKNTGYATSLNSIILDAASFATSAFETANYDMRFDDVGFRGGTTYSLYVKNPRVVANMVDVAPGASGTATIGLFIDSNAIDGNWMETKVSGDYTTVVKIEGSGQLIDNAHFTGGGSTTTNTINGSETTGGGDRNRYVDVYFDTVSTGPLFENKSGHSSITAGWFRAPALAASETYPMVKVSGGSFTLNGTQGEAVTNVFSRGIQITSTSAKVTVVANQFSDIMSPLPAPWGDPAAGDIAPTVHAGNTFRGRRFDHAWQQLTYGSTIATDAAWADGFSIIVTNSSPFSISPPTHFVGGQQISYRIKNGSGGAMGSITWGTGTQFKLAGPFTNPARAKSRTITFIRDETNGQWVELSRSPADI